MSESVTKTASAEKIICQIDGQETHSIQLHIKNNYADTWTIEKYQKEYPDAPLLSEFAKSRLAAAEAAKKTADGQAIANAAAAVSPSNSNVAAALATGVSSVNLGMTSSKLHELFDLGAVPAAMSTKGTPINVNVMTGHDDIAIAYLQDVDKDYVFHIDLLKKVMVALELGFPMLLWGMHGTGKTTIIQQACARTKRPAIRVQHSINMQESEVLGQWTVRDGSTQFQLGPLPMAMLNGWTYIADEYDFAMPSVLAVYQPVLEGQSLLIKDAPPHLRKITPHPNFRFFATGNTNGCGDETGLYQGTLVQNAANYSRFQITEEVKYMDKDIEKAIIIAKTGMAASEANSYVKFANDIREMFRAQKISMTVSTRELISAGKIAIVFGGNWKLGLQLAFANRLPRVDAETISQYLQRIYNK